MEALEEQSAKIERRAQTQPHQDTSRFIIEVLWIEGYSRYSERQQRHIQIAIFHMPVLDTVG